MLEGLDAEQIKRSGWRQGSILDAELVNQLVDAGALPAREENGHWVIVSHDCDVANHSFLAEPRAEVFFGRLIDSKEKDGNQEWGKNSRLLQLSDPPGAQALDHLQFNAHDRHWIQRPAMCGHVPSDRRLDPETISRLAAWIAKRYVRSGFPDEFVERTRAAVSTIRKKSKKDGQYLTGLYLLIKDVELGPDEDYDVILFGAMRDKHYDDVDIREMGNRLFGEIETALVDCDGVNVLGAELRSESAISLTEIRVMKRWDFDDLTLRGEAQDAIPASP